MSGMDSLKAKIKEAQMTLKEQLDETFDELLEFIDTVEEDKKTKSDDGCDDDCEDIRAELDED